MNHEIRMINKNDFPQLLELIREFAVFQKSTEKMQNTLEKMQSEEKYIQGLAAFHQNTMIGYLIYFDAYFSWSGHALYMDDLYVKEEFRGQGTGRCLIQALIDQAKKRGCVKLHWQVSSWNQKAIDFYKSLGAEIDNIELNCDLKL